MSLQDIKILLDTEVLRCQNRDEVSEDKPDPILIAKRYKDSNISLICALFSYGNVKQIIKFLNSLDFSLLTKTDNEIKDALKNHYYRFQKSEDIIALFITLKKLNVKTNLEEVFKSGYKINNNPIDGIHALINKINSLHSIQTRGFSFLIGQVTNKTKGVGALKRWMMFLRWMVRDDNIDMGLWKGINKADLIMPLDTHTFNVSKKLGLLKRKTYDLEAAIELTKTLKIFNDSDPLRYDFAIYRLGQEKKL